MPFMTYFLLLFHFAVVLIFPIYFLGIINRVKSVWGGRKGPKLYQAWFDLQRLLRKTPVYSEVTSWIFPLAPLVVLATVLTASLYAPMVPGFAPLGFIGDFVFFAYLLGLGKLFLMLGALDTGSAFEGMGASREGTYSALVEPVFFVGLGSLALMSGNLSFQDLSLGGESWFQGIAPRLLLAFAWVVLLTIEASRVPADDPTTHLELTMVHEVMVLDHSGPELAFVQYASAVKMTILAGILSTFLNPFHASWGGIWAVLSAITSVLLITVVAAGIGLLESLTARLRFRELPLFTFSAFIAVLVSVALVIANQGAFR